MHMPHAASAANCVALFLSIAVSSVLPPFAIAQSCDRACLQGQRNALSNLFSVLGGPNWTVHSNWTAEPWTEDAGAIHCSWSGVYCCPGPSCSYARAFAGCTNPCAVLALNLADNNLVGRFDSAGFWENLQSIEILNLQGNSLTGSISAGIANLPALGAISVQSNMLSGTIPPELFQSATLTEVILAQNFLSGSIPDMSRLPGLVLMDLGGNQLKNQLPLFWASSLSLEYFSAQNNLLTGSVPITQIPSRLRGSLVEINLRNNQLTGSLPVALARLPIVRLDVGNNQFAGKFNQLLGGLSFLVSFSAEGNMLSGTLPATMASLGLKFFNADNNQLTGSIPATWSKQGLMRTLGLNNNTGLTGVIPASLVTWTSLESLGVDNTSLKATTANANGQMLPPFLYFTGTYSTVGDITNLACNLPGANTSVFPDAKQILLDPSYFHYEGCVCYSGHMTSAANGSVLCEADLVDSHRNISITLLVVVPALIVLFVLMDALGRLRRGSYDKYVKRWIKRRSPPAPGVDITLVSTDVEGSTELWEWDREVMDKAIDVHDNVIRTQLGRFNGYEVTTEGDAFLMAFHDASDAVAWTIATQQALLVAKWPTELQHHPKSCIRQMSQLHPSTPPAESPAAPARQSRHATYAAPHDGEQTRASEEYEEGLVGGHASLDVNQLAQALKAGPDQQGEPHFLQLQDVTPSSVAFWGLAVRMGVATGSITHTTAHPLTRRTVYHGPLVQLVEALVGVAHGGQIITDSSTFSAMSSNLNEITQRVPAQPDYDAMAHHRGHSRVWRMPSQSPMLTDRSPRGSPDSPGLPSNLLTQPSGMSFSTLQSPSAGTAMSQRLSRMPFVSATAALLSGGSVSTANPKSLEAHSLMVMDMGQHVVQDLAQPLTLHQILVPGLEDRARAFPPLSTARQLSPGYFDAPATREAPLGGAGTQGLKAELPLVTLVFSAVDGLKAMRAQGDVAAEHAMTLYKDVVRRLLRTTEGYECQEAEGNFMLAFHKPVKAVQFCLLVQEEMLKVHWRDDVLSLPQCQAQVGAVGGRNQGVIFLGPRIKMGIYEGIPTRVAPHTTTGSTDYFGPFVNRAARFCNGAAHGGQVVGPSAIVPGLLQAWGCEKLPDSQSLGMEPQMLRSASLGSREGQDLLKAKYPPMDHTSPFGAGPHVTHALTQTGRSASPQQASAVPREIALSAVRSAAHPILGNPADPQKLAASWVTTQQYGDTADAGPAQGSGLSTWALAIQPQAEPLQDPSGPLYMHRKGSMGRHSKKFSRPLSTKQPRSSALVSELGLAGSDNSMTALMTVAETEEAEEAKSDSAVAAPVSSTRPSLELRSFSLKHFQSTRSEFGDMTDPVRRRCTGPQLLQLTAERSSAVSVSSLASSVRGNDRLLEALSEVHICHVGKMSFKGLAEPQTVMQFSTAHLAARQFPAEPPSAKATLVEEGQGLQYVVVMKGAPMLPPSRPQTIIV